VSMLIDWQRGRCYLCGKEFPSRGDLFCHDSKLKSVDHVIPRNPRKTSKYYAAKGANKLGNIALAHKKCNNDKSDRDPTACEILFATFMAECIVNITSNKKRWYSEFGGDRVRQTPRHQYREPIGSFADYAAAEREIMLKVA